MRTLRIAVGLAAVVLAASASAQSPGDPFSLIRIVSLDSGIDSNPLSSYRAAGANVDVVGLKAITGSAQYWFLETHGSFASVEALDRAFTNLNRPETRPEVAWLGYYRPTLSYRPEEAFKLVARSRYLQASIYRVRPGAELDFAELVRIRRMGLDSINLDRPEIGYQIMSGARSGMYVFLAPLTTLTTMDNALARPPVYAEGQSSWKATRQIAFEAEISREHLIFRVDPRISYVSESFAAADPEFWHAKQ